MRPVETSEILNLYDYERVREARRRAIIALKSERRVEVGRYLSFVFENRETVWFQIQEMVRAERIVDEGRIAEEVEVYNGLLPRPGELAATMFIEIAESAQIKPVLDTLLGIDVGDHVRLQVGAARGARRVRGRPLRRGARQALGGPLRAVRAAAGRPPGVRRFRGRAGRRPPRRSRPYRAGPGRPAASGRGLHVSRARALLLAGAALTLAACQGEKLSPQAERGRQVFVSQCTACHAFDPAQPGPVGPPVKGSSRALLEAKVLKGTYPPGYTPKRPTAVMPPQPQMAGDIDALAEFLK